MGYVVSLFLTWGLSEPPLIEDVRSRYYLLPQCLDTRGCLRTLFSPIHRHEVTSSFTHGNIHRSSAKHPIRSPIDLYHVEFIQSTILFPTELDMLVFS